MTDDRLVINQPVATGPVQLHVEGTRDLALSYLPLARKLIGTMRAISGVDARMAQGGPGGFYTRSARLPDGTLILVTTNNGLDSVRIVAPPPSVASVRVPQAPGKRVVRVLETVEVEIPGATEVWAELASGPKKWKHTNTWDTNAERMLSFGGWPGLASNSIALEHVARVPTYQEYTTTGGTGGPTSYSGPGGSHFSADVTITWASGLLYETKLDGVTSSGGFASGLYDAIVAASSISDTLGASPSVTLVNMPSGNYYQFIRGFGYTSGVTSSGWAIRIESSDYPADGFAQFMYVFINTNFAGVGTTFAEEFWHQGITNSLTILGYGPGDRRYVRIGVDSGLAYAQYYGASPGYTWLGNATFTFATSDFAGDSDTIPYDIVTPTISTGGQDDATYQSFTPLKIYDLSGSSSAKPSKELWEFTDDSGWRQLADAPVRRSEHVAAWDSINNRLIVSGGWNGIESRTDFYAYNAASNSWEKLVSDPGVSSMPTSFVSDTVSTPNRDLILDGDTGVFTAFPYDGPPWEIVLDSGPPAPRYGFPHLWDPTNKRVLIHGGTTNTGDLTTETSVYGDLWAYNVGAQPTIIEVTIETLKEEDEEP